MEKPEQAHIAYQEMLRPAVSSLRGRDPEDIAQKTGAIYLPGESALEIESMGRKYRISCPSYEITGEIEEWIHLVLMHYLDRSDGTPVSEELCAFGDLQDGLIRGTRFDLRGEKEISRILKGKTEEEIRTVCEAMGGMYLDSKADLSIRIPFLPFYPVVLNIYLADDEFETSGKMLVHRSADHYLSIEDAVTAGEIILKQLEINLR